MVLTCVCSLNKNNLSKILFQNFITNTLKLLQDPVKLLAADP